MTQPQMKLLLQFLFGRLNRKWDIVNGSEVNPAQFLSPRWMNWSSRAMLNQQAMVDYRGLTRSSGSELLNLRCEFITKNT